VPPALFTVKLVGVTAVIVKVPLLEEINVPILPSVRATPEEFAHTKVFAPVFIDDTVYVPLLPASVAPVTVTDVPAIIAPNDTTVTVCVAPDDNAKFVIFTLLVPEIVTVDPTEIPVLGVFRVLLKAVGKL
jgi:hypothetical protein